MSRYKNTIFHQEEEQQNIPSLRSAAAPTSVYRRVIDLIFIDASTKFRHFIYY